MTQTQTPYAIVREQMRKIIRETGLTDTAEIARRVAPLVPEEYVRDVLEKALDRLASDILAEGRPVGPIARPLPPSRPPSSGPAHPFSPRTGSAGGPVSRGMGAKGAQIRDAWQRVLNAYYGTATGQKQLRHFTRADCEYQISTLGAQMDALAEKRRGWNAIAAAITEYDVPTVDDLTAEVKMQLFAVMKP